MISLQASDWRLDGVETVIFDKDGTLTDSHLYWGRIIELRATEIIERFNLETSVAFYEICKAFGYNMITKRLQPEGPVALVSRSKVISVVNTYLIHNYGIMTSVEDMEGVFNKVQEQFQQKIIPYIRVLPGVKEFLDTLLFYNIKMAVVTSDSRESTNLAIKTLGLGSYFDIVIGREDCVGTKEGGAPCQMAVDRLNANPATTITIGDAPVDITMARMCDLLGGVSVCTGQIPEEELQLHTPYVVADLSEITARSTI